MPRIKFTRTYTPQAADAPTYEAGSVHNMSIVSANHFISRGAAIMAPEPEPVAIAEPDPEPAADETPAEPEAVAETEPEPEAAPSSSRRHRR